MGAVTDGEARSLPPGPVPRSPSAAPASSEPPGLPGPFREPLGLCSRTPRGAGLSRTLLPGSFGPLPGPCSPREPLGLSARFSEAAPGLQRVCWEDGRGAGSTRAGVGGAGTVAAVRGRVVPGRGPGHFAFLMREHLVRVWSPRSGEGEEEVESLPRWSEVWRVGWRVWEL